MASAPLVLLADDHEESRSVLRSILESQGWRVLEAADGLACLDAARHDSPDVIVLDLFMPRLDGWDAALELRADPRTTAIPILAYTACDIPGYHRRALAFGCDFVLVKPERPSDVADVIAVLHARHRALAKAHEAALEESRVLQERARKALDSASPPPPPPDKELA